MKRVSGLLAISVAVLLLGVTSPAARDVSLTDMAALQATMQQYVDQKTVDGAYLLFDAEAAQVRELYPVTGHPMVMQFDQHFVLCFDFVDAKGKEVEVDYYIARKGERFVVFHEAVESRAVLEAMVSEGRVTSVR